MPFHTARAPGVRRAGHGTPRFLRQPRPICVPIVLRPDWADSIAHHGDGAPYDPANPTRRISRSHAGGLTLHAQAESGRIGVDLVALDDLQANDCEALVSLTRPRATPEALGIRSRRTLGIWWAATEAAAKAWRGGLPALIGRFQIMLTRSTRAVLVWKDDALPALTFHRLVLRDGLVGMLAGDGACANLSMIAFPRHPAVRHS